jgi:hypothetical protein
MVPILAQIKKNITLLTIRNCLPFSWGQISFAEPWPKGVEALPHCCFFATPALTKTAVRQ